MIPDGVVTWAEIDLDAIAHNVEAIKSFVGPDIEIIASVKANAYGHGLRPVARTALEAGVSRLAVHRIQAAIALREAGIEAPILLLGHVLHRVSIWCWPTALRPHWSTAKQPSLSPAVPRARPRSTSKSTPG